MTSRWVKAVFLILLGIVLLYYADGFVEDLERTFAEETVSFEWTWDLLTVLLWILIAWLFVDAALIIALSFRTDAYTLSDVMERLRAIEKRLPREEARKEPVFTESLEEMEPVVPVNEEEPPPPVE